MSPISHHGSRGVRVGCMAANRFGLTAGVRSVVQVLAVAAAAGAAATLAACTQTTSVNQKPAFAVSAPATQPSRMVSSIVRRPVAVAHSYTPIATRKRASALHAYGLASFYRHGTHTANGEKFDPSKLTAAHRTLPFGTRLKVTDLSTGRSVTVRVNDRGPFIPGRIVDVSHSAAESLGMTGRGLAKVKLDILN
jgi:peptidoglycan lytic transglycosylase